MEDEWDLLEDIELSAPGPKASQLLAEHCAKRNLSLSNLTIQNGRCAWCEKVFVPDKRKYCSKSCSASAMFHFYPQSPETKMWILINRQAAACSGCGESFDDELREIIIKAKQESEYFAARFPDFFRSSDKISYYRIGNNTGDRWQVDHIQPIFKGGVGLGLRNIQVLCVPCHKAKTKREREE
jgi:hypothetical protein